MAPELITHPARDGYPLAARVWRTPSASVRVVVIHGIVSHSGWYLRSCSYLAECGLEVHALDRRGSGVSFAARGDVADAAQWLNDFDDYMHPLNPRLPTVVLGISWGGKLAVLLAARQSIAGAELAPNLVAAGLICPGIYAFQQASWAKQWIVRAATRSGLSNLRVPIPLTDPALFTDNPFYRDYVRDDPFTLRQITLRFAAADFELNRQVRACAEQVQVPMFLMLAGRERIANNPRTRAYWDRIASRHKTLVEYPDAAHTLEFEADPSNYLQDLDACIRRSISDGR